MKTRCEFTLFNLEVVYAVVIYRNDKMFNDEMQDVFFVYSEEDLNDLCQRFRDEQPLTGAEWYVYR